MNSSLSSVVLVVNFDPGREANGAFQIIVDDGQRHHDTRAFRHGLTFPHVTASYDRSLPHRLCELDGFVANHELRPYQLGVLNYYLMTAFPTIEGWFRDHRKLGMYNHRLPLRVDEYAQLRRRWAGTYWRLRWPSLALTPNPLLER